MADNLPYPEDIAPVDPITAIPEPEPLSKLDLVMYSQGLDPDNTTEEDAGAFVNMWAQHMDAGNRSRLTFEPGRRTGLTGDEYFADQLELKNPIDRLKYIQREYDPSKHEELISGWEEWQTLSEDDKFTRAKEEAGEFFNTLPPREALPELGQMGQMSMEEGATYEVGPFGSLLSTGKGNKAAQLGMNTVEKRDRLVQRYGRELQAKDLAKLRSNWDSILSEPSREFAKDVARSGQWSSSAFDSLPEVEQELAARYAMLLRNYSDAGFWGEIVQRSWGGIIGTAEDALQYTANQSARAILVTEGIFAEEGMEGSGRKLFALDDLNEEGRLEDLALGKKFRKREDVLGGAMVLADSLGYMLYAAKGPVGLLRGATAIASYAKNTEDMILDATDGKNPEQAAIMAGVTGVAMFYTERLNDVFDMTPVQKRVMAKSFSESALRFMGGMGKRGAKTITTETMEEELQSWQEIAAKQFVKGEFDQDELVGVTAETAEQMVRAGLWFGALGEVRPATQSIIERFGPGKADMVANNAVNATDTYSEKVQPIVGDTQQVLDAVPEGTTPKALSKVLGSMGIPKALNVAKAILKDKAAGLKFRKEGTAEADKTFTGRDLTTEEETQVTEYAKSFGYETVVEDVVLDERGQPVEALYENGKIRLSRFIESDPQRVIREEVFHGLREDSRVTGEEWDFFQQNMEQMIKDTGVDVNYADLDSITQAEEAVAKQFGDFKPEQKGVFKRIFDWLKKIVGLNKDAGTTTASQIFEQIQQREQGQGRPVADAVGGSPMAGRFTQTSPRALATRIAIGALGEGQGISAKQLGGMFPDTDLDFDIIIADAKEEVSSIREFETDVVKRAGQYTKAARQREVNRMTKEASVRGRDAEKAKQEARKIASTPVDAEVRRAGLTSSGIPLQGIDAPLKKMQDGTLTTNVYATMAELVDGIQDGVESDAFKTSYRATLGKLLNLAARRLVSVKNQRGLSTEINKFAAPRPGQDSVKRIDASYAQLVEKIKDAKVKDTKKTVLGNLRTLAGEVETKRNKAKFKDVFLRDISVNDVKVVQAYNKATKLSEGKEVKNVTKLRNAVAIIVEPNNSKQSEVQAAYDEVYRLLPSLKKLPLEMVADVATTASRVYAGLGTANSTVAEAQTAYDNLQEFLTDAKGNQAAVLEQRAKENAEKTAAIVTPMEVLRDKFTFMSQLASSLMTPLQFLETFMRGADKDSRKQIFQTIIVPFVNARGKFRGAEKANIDTIKGIVQSTYGSAAKSVVKEYTKLVDAYAEFSVDGTPMSHWQLLNTIVMLQNSDVQEQAEAKKNEGLLDQIDQLPQMLEMVSDKDIIYMDSLRSVIDGRFKEVADRFRDLTGGELTKADMYWPIVRQVGNTQLIGFTGTGLSIYQSFLKDRVPSTRPIETALDINEQFLNHMNAVDHFIAYSDVQLLARDVLLSEPVINTLTASFGKAYATHYMESILDEVNGFINNPGKSRKGWDVMRKGVIQMGIPYNQFGALRQLADVPSVASRTGAKFWLYLPLSLGKLAISKAGMEAYQTLANDPGFLADTTLGGHPEISMQFRQLLSEPNAAVRIKDFLRDIVMIGDAWSRLMVGPAVLQSVYQMPDILAIEDAELQQKTAVNMTVRIMQETLQSPAQADRPSLARRGGSVGKFFGTFTTALTPKISSTALALDQAIANKDMKSAKLLGKQLLYFHFIGGLLQYAVRYAVQWGTRDEDDDEWMRHMIISMLQGPLGGIPYFGSGAEQAVSAVAGEPAQFRQPVTLVTDIAVDTGKIFYALGSGDMEETWKQAVETVVGATALGRVSENLLKKFNVIEKD